MKKLLYWISGYLRCRLIKIKGQPYLERYYVGKLFGVTFFLHRFVSGDGDRYLHDHPFSYSGAVILSGGYTEVVLKHLDPINGQVVKYRAFYPGRVNLISSSKFHKVISVKPETWTLFWHTKRIKHWGFMHFDRKKSTITYKNSFPPTNPNWQDHGLIGKLSGREPFNKKS